MAGWNLTWCISISKKYINSQTLLTLRFNIFPKRHLQTAHCDGDYTDGGGFIDNLNKTEYQRNTGKKTQRCSISYHV